MKTLFILALAFVLNSCAQIKRQPAHDDSVVFVEFTDSGLDSLGKMFHLEAHVMSNHMDGLKSVSLVIGQDVIKKLELIEKNHEFFINAKIPKRLPASTKVRFSFNTGEVKEVDLVCTRTEKCF